MHEYEVIAREQLATARWSGGTTTQLGIWPRGAVYADRNFTWRVSTATVEAEESEFTPLPGIDRILMILDGRLELTHVGQRSVTLDRFAQDSFPGDWKTASRGRVIDFNLMMSGGKGAIDALHIPAGSEIVCEPHFSEGAEDYKYCGELFYALCDGIFVETAGGQTFELRKGDVLTSHSPAGETARLTIKNSSAEEAQAIRASMLFD